MWSTYIISYVRCKIKEEEGTYTDGKVESHAAFGVSLQLSIGQEGHSTSWGIQPVVTQQHVVAYNSSIYSSHQHVVAYNSSMYSSALHSSQQHVVATQQLTACSGLKDVSETTNR